MEYWLDVVILVGIYMIAILGVLIPCGFTGMFSMGHAGFMTVGAYTSALLARNFDMSVFLGVIASVMTASAIGTIISYPTPKPRDNYLIIVTLGIGKAIKLIVQNTTSTAGGARGLADIPKGSSFVNVWIIMVIAVIVLKSFINPHHGRSCVVVQGEKLAVQSMGISVSQYKMETMVINCALCGCVGALLGYHMHYLRPNMFIMVKSDELVIMVILSGRGSPTDMILADLLMPPLPELLRFDSAEQWRMVLCGFLMVIATLFRPAGIMGTCELTTGDLKSLVDWVGGKFSKNNPEVLRKEQDL